MVHRSVGTSAVFLCSLAWAAVAAAVPTPKLVVASDSGSPVVYELGDGSYLGLWTFAFSDHASAVTLAGPDELLAGFSGGEILGFFDPTFAPFAFPQTFDRGRHQGALWVQWRPTPGPSLTYSWNYVNRGGITREGSETLAATATRPGDPLARSIAEPSTYALLVLGLGVLAFSRPRMRPPFRIPDSI